MALNWEALLGATRNLGNVVDTRLNRRANVVQGGIDRVLDMLRGRAERRQQREMPGIEAEAALAEVKGTPSATAEGWAKVYPGMDPSAALEKGMALGPLAQAKGKLAEIRGALPAQAQGAREVFGGDAASALGREATIGLTEQIDADVERARQISEQITMPEMREGARLEGEAREDEQAYGQGQFDEEMRYRYASLAQDKRLRELAIEAENGRAEIAKAKAEGLWEAYAIILDQIAVKDENGNLDKAAMIKDIQKYRTAFLGAAKSWADINQVPGAGEKLAKIFDAVAATWELVESADYGPGRGPAGPRSSVTGGSEEEGAGRYIGGGIGAGLTRGAVEESERLESAWNAALSQALGKLEPAAQMGGTNPAARNKQQQATQDMTFVRGVLEAIAKPGLSWEITGRYGNADKLEQLKALLTRLGIGVPQ